MKKKLIPYLSFFAALLIVTLSSCADDPDPNEVTNNALNGDWEVESFTIDGVENMVAFITSFDMEYEKQGPADGETEWTLIYIDGSTQKIEGDYEIENSGTEIDIDGDELDITIDGDDLELEGNIGGELWVIKAERD